MTKRRLSASSGTMWLCSGSVTSRACDQCGHANVHREPLRTAVGHGQGREPRSTDAFWSALDELPANSWRDERNPDQRWSGGFGSIDDGNQIPVQLARLYTRDGDRAAIRI